MANPIRHPPPVPRQSMQSASASQPGSNANKSANYVFFERTTAGFSDDAIPRAKTAQLKLEHYYKVAVDAAIERNTRCVLGLTIRWKFGSSFFSGRLNFERRVELERRLMGDALTSEDRKQRQLQQLGKKESTFLRLRRTKLGLNDFRTVKVIGKGAFGEVSNSTLCNDYD